jgi:GDPmannose 4,6-dehydratase
MWLMLQQDTPEDFVISTGETHSIEELVETAFTHAGLEWKDHVVIDPKFVRPAEVDLLLGDSSQAREKLKWEPKIKFEELIRMMVDFDIKRYEAQKHSS